MSELIDRQAALDIFDDYNVAVENGQIEAYSRDRKRLCDLPPAQLGTNLAEVDTDTISRQAAIDEILGQPPELHYPSWYAEQIKQLPPAQPERTCVNCGRTANNGGWYADGKTRCPIEEHYALPKDGYCHLWEKRNVTDDDYPEGRADE